MYSNEKQRSFFDRSKQMLNAEVSAEQIAELREILVYHEWRYYVQNDPVISDFEYDQLYKKLEAIEQAQPELITPDSPTQRVSNDLTSDFESVEHLTPMLSLDNSYNAEDLLEFDKQIKKLVLRLKQQR